MPERRQEKLGWVGGWLGGFIWVLILSVLFLFQGRAREAGVGLLISGAACGTVFFCAPWRYPRTTYRRLMVPMYTLLFAAVAWGAWSLGDLRQAGIHSWWTLLLVLPVLMPLWSVGDRRWVDHDA
jgi:hypothetical protein